MTDLEWGRTHQFTDRWQSFPDQDKSGRRSTADWERHGITTRAVRLCNNSATSRFRPPPPPIHFTRTPLHSMSLSDRRYVQCSASNRSRPAAHSAPAIWEGGEPLQTSQCFRQIPRWPNKSVWFSFTYIHNSYEQVTVNNRVTTLTIRSTNIYNSCNLVNEAEV